MHKPPYLWFVAARPASAHPFAAIHFAHGYNSTLTASPPWRLIDTWTTADFLADGV